MTYRFFHHAASEEDTQILAYAFAQILCEGDIIFLQGNLGSGKSFFTRQIIRYLTGDTYVPSPTFSLVQHYDGGAIPILHADLYRLQDIDEVLELGILDDVVTHILFIEWAERGQGVLPKPHYVVNLAETENNGREITIEAADGAQTILENAFSRAQETHAFLTRAGWAQAQRQVIAGDASTRRYERLTHEDKTAILMDWPHGPDGPPIYDGKPYSALVHLAEAAPQFCSMIDYLRQAHIGAPEIYAQNTAKGVVMLEDLGALSLDHMVRENHADVPAIYLEAVETLAHLHKQKPKAGLAKLDAAVMAHEAALFYEWYLPYRNVTLDATARAAWMPMWAEIYQSLGAFSPVTVLRDYHSPNLLWRPELHARFRVGVIDVQDALCGHAAYDMASLLYDARIDVPDERCEFLREHYLAHNIAEDARAAFRDAISIFAMQRNLKIAGIFVRLAKRDAKADYLRHLPRIERYVATHISAPPLAPLRAWWDKYIPDFMI